MFGDDLGEAVVEQADQVLELLRLVHALGRRHRIGEDLRVVVEHVDDLEAYVEIVDARDLAHPLADVLMVAGEHLDEVFLRNEMRVRVDAHGGSPAGAWDKTRTRYMPATKSPAQGGWQYASAFALGAAAEVIP